MSKEGERFSLKRSREGLNVDGGAPYLSSWGALSRWWWSNSSAV